MRYAWLLATVAIAAWSLVAYQDLLALWPWDNDAVVWVEKGSWEYRKLWRWILDSPHFIAYRPVAAASFLLNDSLPTESWLFRGFDLLFHAAALVMVALTFRTLTHETRGRPGWGVVAALLFALHPASDEIVSFASRRSYSMSVVFGLLALVGFAHAARAPSALGRRTLGASAMLTLALLTNEIAFVLVPVVLLVVANEAWKDAEETGADPMQLVYKPMLLPLLLAGLVWIRRWAVLGRLGGYHRHYIAFADNGAKAMKRVSEVDPVDAFVFPWSYVTAPVSYGGADPISPVGEGAPWLAGFLVVVVLMLAARRHREVDGRLGAILAIWLGGAVTMCALSEVWFWRLGYALALPYSLMLAWVLRELVEHLHDAVTRAAGGLLATFAIVPVVAHASMVNGFDTTHLVAKFRGSAIIHILRETIEEASDEGAIVYIAVPINKTRLFGVRTWLQRLGPNAEIQPFVYSATRDGVDLGEVRVGKDGKKRFHTGADADMKSPWYDTIGPKGLVIDRLRDHERPTMLLYPRSLRAWEVERMAPDPQGGPAELKGRKYDKKGKGDADEEAPLGDGISHELPEGEQAEIAEEETRRQKRRARRRAAAEDVDADE
jgi:hypothetical protein